MTRKKPRQHIRKTHLRKGRRVNQHMVGKENRLDFPTKNMEKRQTHIKIYIPSTQNIDKKISSQQMNQRIKETVGFVNKTFGGTTRVLGVGSWSNNNEIIDENVVLVESFSTREDYLKKDQAVGAWLKKKRVEWGQEAISYEYNGSLYFVEKDSP